MALSLKKAREEHGFGPELSYGEAEFLLDSNSQRTLNNDALYFLVKKLTETAIPKTQDQYDTRWQGFYLPVRRSGKLISMPFSVMLYQDG